MQLMISKKCPAWVTQNVNAAIAFMGNDPVRIGKHLETLPYLNSNLGYWESKISPGMFQHHKMIVSYGEIETPWLHIMPNGGTLNHDELVKLF